MPIEVVPYDESWPMRFARIRSQLSGALTGLPILAIEHVGSTSVPALAAKPVIDIDVVVARADIEAAIAALERIGYRHRGDLGIPDRHSLAEPDDGVRRNVYVVADGALALRNHLAVRDALRTDAALRHEYGRLKSRLAREFDSVDDYVDRKTDFLARVLARAGFSDAELDSIRAANRRRR